MNNKLAKPPKQLKQSDIPSYRAAILKKQNGLCIMCGHPPHNPVLDHHHTKKNKGTGLIRGVLCSGCNVLLAKMENNCIRYGVSHEKLPYVLNRMADYLRKPQYSLIHPSEKAKAPRIMKSSWNELKAKGKKMVPPYPKNGKMNARLEKAFLLFNIEPRYYK